MVKFDYVIERLRIYNSQVALFRLTVGDIVSGCGAVVAHPLWETEVVNTAQKYFREISVDLFIVGAWRSGSAPVLGAGGRKFESCRPDQSKPQQRPSLVLGLLL